LDKISAYFGRAVSNRAGGLTPAAGARTSMRKKKTTQYALGGT
jgi:hypothetical protein